MLLFCVENACQLSEAIEADNTQMRREISNDDSKTFEYEQLPCASTLTFTYLQQQIFFIIDTYNSKRKILK